MPRPTPYLLSGWLRAWLRHHGAGLELALHVAHRNDRLVGLLPLAIERRFGVRVARFVGGDHVELADVVAVDDEVAAALARRAAEHDHDVAIFLGLPRDSRLQRALGTERLVLLERAEAPVLDLSDGWERVYERKVPSKRRYEHRRKRKKLGEQGALEVRLARTWDELEPTLEAGFELYARRWEGRPERHGFATPPGRALHRDAFRALAQDDAVRIVSLWLDGRLVAFHSYFVVGRTLCSDRLAFDGELARWSPGFLNTLDMLDAASAEGLTRVEFLGGTEEYKLALADALDPVYEAVGLVRTARGRGAAVARIAAVRSRRRLKQSDRLRTLYYERLGPLRRLVARATDR
jgi:CelD/BcsL family acetyltransferase involved in cellulose biosynthesis